MPPLNLVPPALQRRIAKAALHRPPRYLHSTPPLLRDTETILPSETPRPKSRRLPRPRPLDAPHPTALSAILSRLSLPPNPALHNAILACLTHPSYAHSPASSSSTDPNDAVIDTETRADTSPALAPSVETNELLSSLGNSLLGLFASEHLSHLYPLLPTEALKTSVTAFVGPKACYSVARELGIGVQGGGNTGQPRLGQGSASAGVTVRWKRAGDEGQGPGDGPESTPVARRFRRFGKGGRSEEEAEVKVQEVVDKSWHRRDKRESFEEMVAMTVKAFVGLIYQEQGIHAARTFTHAFFLSRHLDLPSLFNFKNPKHVLSSIVARHLIDAGVHPSNGVGRVEARLLASTGANSQAPLFNVGMFTSFGLKLGEGHGSSVRMAEHRAATNALLEHFLVRGDQPSAADTILGGKGGLPSTAHVDFPVDRSGLVGAVGETYYGASGFGGRETVVESSRGKARGGREKGAVRTTAL